MNILEPLYHNYELGSFEGTETQNVHFIHKEEKDGHLVTIKDGTTNEEVLRMLIHRLEGLDQKLHSHYSANAIVSCKDALMWLEKRTADRKKRGVEGTHNA